MRGPGCQRHASPSRPGRGLAGPGKAEWRKLFLHRVAQPVPLRAFTEGLPRRDADLRYGCASAAFGSRVGAPSLVRLSRRGQSPASGRRVKTGEATAQRRPQGGLEAAAGSGIMTAEEDGTVQHWLCGRVSLADQWRAVAWGPARAGRGLPKAGGRALTAAPAPRSSAPSNHDGRLRLLRPFVPVALRPEAKPRWS
jgi:hypothetical protein